MNYIGQVFEFIQKLVIWWVTIMPWEKAVHVRMGNKVRVISAGIHMRIPFVDRVFVQTTRLRVLQAPLQTMTTLDGKTVTLVIAIGYTITDIEKVYMQLFQAEQTLANIVMGTTAEIINRTDLANLSPVRIEKQIIESLKDNQYGLNFEYMKVVGFAVVRTYRIIQDGHWLPDALNTSTQK